MDIRIIGGGGGVLGRNSSRGAVKVLEKASP